MTIQKYCVAAFSQLRISPHGGLKLCCKQREWIGNSNEDSLLTAVNSPMAREIRLKLIRGEWPDECGVCRDQEALGASSWRLERNRDFTDAENAEIAARTNAETGEIAPQLSAVEVAFSNLCNLACKMCQPDISTTFGTLSQRSERLKKMFPIENLMQRAYGRSEFMDELVAIAPSLKFLCVTGGEPFMSSEFHNFIDRLGEHKQHITFLTTSNLTQLRHGKLTIMERLSGFKAVQLSVSVEGPKPVHDYIRYPSQLEVVLDNARKLRNGADFEITSNITVGALNILRMPEAIEIVRKGFDPSHILFSFVDEFYLRVECLPKPLRALAASRLNAYRQARPYAGSSVEPDIESMMTVVAERLNHEGNFDAFIEYLKAQDEATGQRFLDCVPELKNYLPTGEPSPEREDADASKSSPAVEPIIVQPVTFPIPLVSAGTVANAASTHERPPPAKARKKAPNDSASLCVIPWIHTQVQLSGDMKLCCVANNPGRESDIRLSVRERPIAELFQSDYMQKVRAQMLAGEWPAACESCKRKQEIGVSSYRDTYNTKHSDYYEVLRTAPEKLEPKIRSLNLYIKNLCNFKCRMCTGVVSSRWQEDHEEIYPGITAAPGVHGIHDVESFWTEFNEKMIPDLEEIHFAGGEPLIIEEHYKILDMLIRAGRTDVALRYDTNLSKLSLKHWDIIKLWQKFPRIHISMSNDGVGRLGEYIRYGMDYDKWCEHIGRIKKAVPHAHRSLHFVINAYNVLDFQKHYDTLVACQLVPQENIGFTFLEWPAYLSVQALHPTLKEQARRKLLAMAETDP